MAADKQFDIDKTPERLAAFLATIAVESDELTRLQENLNYSADRLRVVWPKRFPTETLAQKYAHNAIELADYVYANREGNGPESSKDGYRFRGRGPIQITFKNNYQALATALKDPSIMLCPDKLCTKRMGALAACWFWNANWLNELADDLPDDDQDADFITITRRVNGGLHGLEKRQKYLAAAQRALKEHP